MRTPITQRLSATGFAPWIPVNREQVAFNVSLGVAYSSDGNATVAVQHTFDDLWREYTDFSAARVTTVVTVTQTNHGLSTSDWVYVKNGGGNFDGFFAVASAPSSSTFTYTVANSGITAPSSSITLQKARVRNHLTMVGMTASGDGNYISPVVAVRLSCSVYAAGFVELMVNQGMGR